MSDFMIKNGNTYVQPLQRYVADSEADKDNIGLLGVPIGSTCYVIDTKKNYMLDGTGEWAEVENSGGGSALPAVTSDDNGDVLTVVDGVWDKAEASGSGSVPFLTATITFDSSGQMSGVTLDKTYSEILTYLNANGSVNYFAYNIVGYQGNLDEPLAVASVKFILDGKEYAPADFILHKIYDPNEEDPVVTGIAIDPCGFGSLHFQGSTYEDGGNISFSGGYLLRKISLYIRTGGTVSVNISALELSEDGSSTYGGNNL